MLHCSALVAGIVVSLLTGMPKHMLRKKLLSRGVNPHYVDHAEACIQKMLLWDMIPQHFFIAIKGNNHD